MSLLEMRYLSADLATENWIKSVGKNFTDSIIDGHNLSVRNALVTKKKKNITNKKTYP